MTQKPYLIIGNKKFVLYGDSIDLYHEDRQNFVIYQGDKIPINLDFNLPDIRGRTVPISIKFSSDIWRIQISQAEYSEYKISNNINSSVVHSGESDYIDISGGSTELKYYFRTSKETKNNFNLTFEFGSIGNKDYSENDIENSINRMYSDTDDSIETIEKDGEYSLDLNLLLNLDKFDNVYVIGTGGYRRVFKISDKVPELDDSFVDKVVKVAFDMKGVESNRREHQTWQAVKSIGIDELQSLFCPIVDRGPSYRYIVMEAASDGFVTSEKVDEIKSTIKKYMDSNSVDIPGSHNLDIRSGNIGEYDGRKVLLDYPYGGSLF
jgi:hypothetical protein